MLYNNLNNFAGEEDFIARPANGGPGVRIPANGIHENVDFFARNYVSSKKTQKHKFAVFSENFSLNCIFYA